MDLSQIERAFSDACKRGDAALCRDMLRTQPNLVDARLTAEGFTGAHMASLYRKVNISKMLVAEYGADVNATDCHLGTHLHYAMSYNQLKYGVFLIEHGADPSAKDRNGKRPFDIIYSGLNTVLAVRKAYAKRTRDCLLAFISIYPQVPLDLHELIMSCVLELFQDDLSMKRRVVRL